MEKYKYIVVGSGPAGITATKYILTTIDHRDDLLLITKEKSLYNRICLIDYIFDEVDINKICYPQDLTKNLNLTLADEVIKIDVDKKLLVTKNNRKLKYEKLLLCTGATPTLPNIHWLRLSENICCIRTIEDAEKIKSKIKHSNHISIVGCGAVGIELLDGLVKHYPEKKVVVIEKNAWILPSLLTYRVAFELLKEIKSFIKLHNAKVDFFFNNTVKKLKLQGSKILVMLSNGKEFYTDLIVFATGVTPNNLLGKLSVDDYCRTSYHDVYVCGDAAIFGGRYYPNFQNAVQMGIIAAKNVLGENVKLENYQQSNIIEVFNLTIQVQNFCEMKDKKTKVKLFDNNKAIRQFISVKDNKICSIVYFYRDYVDIKHSLLKTAKWINIF